MTPAAAAAATLPDEPQNSDVEKVQQALTDFSLVAAGLAALKDQFGGIVYSVTTPEGMDSAKEARRLLREPRYRVEQIRKAAKAPLLALGRRIDSEAARIEAELLSIERPIDEQIKAEEQRKEREKAERAAAELARVELIQKRIEAIRQLPVKALGKPSADVQVYMDQLRGAPVDDSFAEFRAAAQAAFETSLAALQGLHAQAVADEAERARVAAERAELERLRAEAQAREAEERAAREAEAAKQKAERDAEAARQAEALRQERAQLDAQRAEHERTVREAEERQNAEARRIAEERAALDRQREEAAQAAAAEERRKAEAEAAEAARLAQPADPVRPSDRALERAVALAFFVPEHVAADWLATYGEENELTS